ncbi:hypothetical protein TNCV_1144651 [Trichonephila clavipes]|nr:hypothetical protein TNCV_1144651 [Trichonephila clavipes]
MLTPKYCGVLSSDIAPATYDREWLDICEPETPSVIRGGRKKPPHSTTMEGKEIPLKTPKRTVVLPPPSQITYSEPS